MGTEMTANVAICGGTGRWAGAALAVALLVCSGAAYRSAVSRFASVRAGVPLERGTLGAMLPLQIGDWIGRDVTLGEALVENTGTDDHVNRSYARAGSAEAVSLFIGYGIRMRDLMPHRPEVCYPGAGWTLHETRRVDVLLEDGSVIPVQIHRFDRGGLLGQATCVLNYYILDGRYSPDVSLLRSQAWKLENDIAYVAQVQIASPGPRGEAAVRAFVTVAAREVERVLQQAVQQALATGARVGTPLETGPTHS